MFVTANWKVKYQLRQLCCQIRVVYFYCLTRWKPYITNVENNELNSPQNPIYLRFLSQVTKQILKRTETSQKFIGFATRSCNIIVLMYTNVPYLFETDVYGAKLIYPNSLVTRSDSAQRYVFVSYFMFLLFTLYWKEKCSNGGT